MFRILLMGLLLQVTSLIGADAFQPYQETLPGSNISFEMVPIEGGGFLMGSSQEKPSRDDDEGPRHAVEVDSFWMGKVEVTWNEYDRYAFATNNPLFGIPLHKALGLDAITKPTSPYLDPTFGLGHNDQPVISITHHAAMEYCRWLSEVTGKSYRLPTEAEWEYAARAGSTTARFFGEDPEQLKDYAWFAANSNEKPQPVGQKLPNPWGLLDIYGNVSEWVMDAYKVDFYESKEFGDPAVNPVAKPTDVPYVEFSYAARGGSWMDRPEKLRSADRIASNEDWSMNDPQMPKSIWWHTNAQFVGFRVVRPYR